MNETKLECVIVQDENIAVKSPRVGRLRLLVGVGTPVVSGQMVAELYQLNHKSYLCLPEGCDGVVTQIKNNDMMIMVSYNESFLTISSEQLASSSINSKSIHKPSEIGRSIDSPMDGMLYLSASPKDAPFVNIGDEITPGQTIGLIEVMKSFYPLKYQGRTSAKITDVMVKTATPIKCGMKLFSIQDIGG